MKSLKRMTAVIFCLSLIANLNIYGTDPTALMDFDGDGKTDVSVYDELPLNNQTPPGSHYYRYISSITGNTVSNAWGITLDNPAPADYDGDGKTDMAIFRWWNDPDPTNGINEWWIQGSTAGQLPVTYGGPSSHELVKVPRDYDGDGKANIAFAYLECDYGDPEIPEDDYCGYYYSYKLPNGESIVTQLITVITYNQTLGGGGAAPGDYDGDGTSEIAVYSRTEQKFKVYAVPYSPVNVNNIAREKSMDLDFPVPGDYNGDGRTDFAGVKNFQTQTVVPMIWKVQYNKRTPNGPTGFEAEWGMSNEFPVPGDYDGDGKTDLAVYNKQTGTWKIRQSSDLSTVIKQLGDAGDFPVTFPLATESYFNPLPSSN